LETFLKAIGLGLILFVVVTVISVFMAFPVMWLVNSLFTPFVLLTVFGSSQIGFWQALGLSLLTGVLFKGSSSSSSK
jgi:hypothetical protein